MTTAIVALSQRSTGTTLCASSMALGSKGAKLRVMGSSAPMLFLMAKIMRVAAQMVKAPPHRPTSRHGRGVHSHPQYGPNFQPC
jgi:hypothetical protein